MKRVSRDSKAVRAALASPRGRYLVIGLAAFLVLWLALWLLMSTWPLPQRLEQRDYATMLLARDGELLGAHIAGDEQWRFAPVEQLPDKYRQALLLFEDRRFPYHPGVDPLAIIRAARDNWQADRVTSGGSTLTMQLARMLRDDPPRNLRNKLVEALSAFHLEWHFSKEELLVHYASHAPFGGNIVGLNAAAWRYFGREPQALSWAEAALLAVLPNSPALIHPGRQRDRLQVKRDRLLQHLHETGAMTDLDLELALMEPLPDKPQPLPRHARHLLASLKADYPDQPIFHSSLDASLQTSANRIAEQHGRRLAGDGVHNLALVVIDHEHMQTRAYVGNQAASSDRRYAPDLDIARRPRSSGSLLKPLLYGLMLEEGELLPTTLVPDIPAYFGGYRPQNFDRQYRGAVPAHRALSRSLNVPSVYMLRNYGIGRFHHQLQDLGMSTLFRPADDYGLSLILGGAETTLWEMTTIYAHLTATARNGRGAQSVQARRLTNEVVWPAGESPIGQGAAWLTLQAMIEVTRPGSDSLWRDFSGSQQIAWKTGTSYGLRDAWAIGSNGRYTVGVWAGNAGGEPAPALSGQRSAAPILFDVFEQLGAQRWFPRPEHALKTLSVCKTDGYLSGGQCDSEEGLAPSMSHFQAVTPHHKRIHLDTSGQFRVHSGCEAVSNMQSADWFILPPAQAHYWRQHHSDYRPLPPWRVDCLASLNQYADDQPMDLLYPHEGSQVYVPVDLGGKRSRVILSAVHRRPESNVFWHLDDRFLGSTHTFHEQAVNLEPGWHKLQLVDAEGYELKRWFRVLGAE